MGADQAWILVALPAAAFVVLSLCGRWLPRKGDWLAVLAVGAALVLFFFVLHDFLHQRDALMNAHEYWSIGMDNTWSHVGNFQLVFGTYVDPLSAVMLGVVLIAGTLITIFSVGYMKGEVRYWWFFAVLMAFIAAKLMLVLSDNLLLLYFAWEGVGVCSFLLIGFYWEKRSAAEAAKKAFVTTRIGDVGLLIGIILLYKATGTFNIQDILTAATTGQIGDHYLFVSLMFIFLGAMGKSALFPFHVWLPDAMEGPTPVSALIHAATMVVAGVYLVARLLPAFEVVPAALLVITIVGLITAILTGFMALATTDIKKVLAYSTIGQLGFMYIALGCSHPDAAIMHLMTHAFFKSLLFMAAGSVIIGTHHHQDMDDLGGLWRKMPITTVTFLIGSLALAAVPPFSGFWSKDEIFHATSVWHGGWVTFLLGFAALLTALYTTRLFIRTFLGKPRNQAVHDNTHETGLVMTGPLIILALLTCIAGFTVFNGVGRAIGFPGGFPEFVFLHEPERFVMNWSWAAASGAIAFGGLFLAGWIYWGNRITISTRLAEWQPGMYQMLVNKFYFDDLYQAAIDRGLLGFSYVVSWFDRYVVNDTGVDGVADSTRFGGSILKYVQTGKVPNYALGIALGAVGLAIAGLVVRG